jgi:hypothetical protein
MEHHKRRDFQEAILDLLKNARLILDCVLYWMSIDRPSGTDVSYAFKPRVPLRYTLGYFRALPPRGIAARRRTFRTLCLPYRVPPIEIEHFKKSVQISPKLGNFH